MKAESWRAIEKDEITSTEFPEGGNTTSTVKQISSFHVAVMTTNGQVLQRAIFDFPNKYGGSFCLTTGSKGVSFFLATEGDIEEPLVFYDSDSFLPARVVHATTT